MELLGSIFQIFTSNFLYYAPAPFLITLVIQLLCCKAQHKLLRHGSLFYTTLSIIPLVPCLIGCITDPEYGPVTLYIFLNFFLIFVVASLMGYGLAWLIHKIRTR